MAITSGIQWTDATFNPWIGCTQVSPACDNCYAMVMNSHRQWAKGWGPGVPRHRTSASNWRQPLTWNRKAGKEGKRIKVFCASLADVFDSEVPDVWRTDLWNLILETPNLDWLLLTKRTSSIARMVPWTNDWPDNVWIGTSVENQIFANRRLPILSEIQAKVRFISAEPLLGDFSLGDFNIDWVIAGGESGSGWREMNVDHVRSLRDQCRERDIAFFFKQYSGFNPHDLGREVDGVEWNQFPLNSVYNLEQKMSQKTNEKLKQISIEKVYRFSGQEFRKVSTAELKNPEVEIVPFDFKGKRVFFTPVSAV